ncbi:EF-hand domain-containing protein 1-like [Galleria mellonella]|uniref:EF-hand domain-containing protein 1-like n=1 Tax=Galleria mellonella TaxID=7137 RepID=A0ABM3MRL2_GALME|nr:EF-hand domain-containing protein 1-like [Galleria mellonella]XP_052753825.1 EF-hand domain-containing protein 1-like [Galleria mellonella]
MAWGLPKLPGLTFSDPTKTQYHIRSSLRYYQGHRFPDTVVRGPGGTATDVDSNAFTLPEDSVNYDPSLTYGRVKQPAMPAVVPHWVHYDKRCLNFTAFFKQPVYENPDENYRVRVVNIVYFLEDDTLTVMEPRVKNSGLWQGRLVKRGKIPKNDVGDCWHWKDLDIGKDICIYGKVFHTVSCDLFTKEWLESQGLELSKEEDLPIDAYMQKKRWKTVRPPQKMKSQDDRLRRYLEYDGKVLAFDVVWDDRESENGDLREYKLLYFLQDDTIAIKELHDGKGGKDPFPLLLKKTKLPKKWKEKPVSFPSTVMEITDAEVTEYYAPMDLIVGQTIFVLGRRFLLCDCDNFTRKYYKTMLNIDQPARIEVRHETTKEFPKSLPPHIGIGAPEDTLQSCFGLIPKPPHKDIIKYNLNANKYLRYLCELDWIHPEDNGRRFVLAYSLADGTVKIGEIPRRNSGIREGKFLKPMRLQMPDSDPNFPTYYTPDKFYIGAIVPVFKHRFKIIGCDLYVYRYMSANPEKFPQEVIDNVRNYHMREGNLKDELKQAINEEQAAETRAQLAKIGQAAVAEPNAMERCLMALDVVEGSATPPRPPTPPMTTDVISYDDSLRVTRQSKPTCDEILPLKGILKSGTAQDDHQKMVCFSGPAPDEHREPRDKPIYPPGQQSHFNDNDDFCERRKDPNTKEREERRARDECPYEIIPSAQLLNGTGEESSDKPQLPGYLGTYEVDCKQVPEHMRLSPNAYEKIKKLRSDVPEISPAATRVSHYPQLSTTVESCVNPQEATGPCAPRKEEDVAFSCSHVEPIKPCCDSDKKET